jgi:hypothetical protein
MNGRWKKDIFFAGFLREGESAQDGPPNGHSIPCVAIPLP